MTKLLISVKDLEEASIAMYAGVNVIDLKDPENGALGALAPSMVSQIVTQLMKSKSLVSATVGEYHQSVIDLVESIECYANLGVDIIKLSVTDLFYDVIFLEEMQKITARGIQLVAVFFAEKEIDVNLLKKIAKAGFYGAMLDTQIKSHCLIDIQTKTALCDFTAMCKKVRLVSGLAGSVNKIHIKTLLTYHPDFIGMRGGVCDQNDRTSYLQERKVIAINELLLNYNKDTGFNEVLLDAGLHIEH